MKKLISIIIAIVLVGFLIFAVTFHKKLIPIEKPGKVVATAAYEKYFGAAPAVDKAMAYAFVIYFPSIKSPDKVIPFPFFTFDEGSLKKVAVERLLGGMDTGSYQGEFITFPSGSRLIAINEDQGTVTINLSKELDTSAIESTARSVALTLLQFKAVKDVRIQIEGKEIPLSSGEYELLMTFLERSQRVLNRDQLLDLTKHRHAEPFDRSVDVQISRLRKKIEMDPKNPKILKTIRGGGYIFACSVNKISLGKD